MIAGHDPVFAVAKYVQKCALLIVPEFVLSASWKCHGEVKISTIVPEIGKKGRQRGIASKEEVQSIYVMRLLVAGTSGQFATESLYQG